jgi:hypothetical protein
MAIKHENDDFLFITLKHVSGHKVVVNRLGTPKKWAIAHENVYKTRKLQVFNHISQNLMGLIGHANQPRTQKLWAIPNENGHKTRKQRVFSNNSQTCIGFYGRCKSPWNLKTVGNSS